MSEADTPSSALPPGMDRDGELSTQGYGTAVWVTDVGHVRSRNEDRLLVKPVWGGEYLLLLVADGAGGHDNGDKAAQATVETFHAELSDQGSPPDEDPGAWILAAIKAAHAKVIALAEGQARPPASTVVGVIVERASLCGWRFHVGDSRLYVRPPGGMVAQWTRDHNITNGLIDRGLPVAQALRIADGGRLTQVLGGASNPEPEVLGPLQFSPGTVLLLCSDGIYGHNEDREVLLPVMNPDRAPVGERLAELKQAVLDGDAPDNLTAVLWQVPEDAEATREREVVTNSMNAISVEDVEKKLAAKVRSEMGMGPGPDDEPSEPVQPQPSLRTPLLIAMAIFVVFVVLRMRDREETAPPEPAAAEEEAELPDEASSEPLSPASAFDFAASGPYWDALSGEERAAIFAELALLQAGTNTAFVQLRWPPGEGGMSYEMGGWRAAAPGTETVAKAWAARNRILAQRGALAEQVGVSELLRRVACARAEVDWPRGDSLDPGEALQLASWLTACLPEGSAAELTVHLGGWPVRGWTSSDLNAARFLALKPDGGRDLLDYASAQSPRMLELGLLARALQQPAVEGIEVTIEVVQPTGDLPEGATPAEGRLLAEGRAVELASLLRRAAYVGVTVHGAGRVSDDLTDIFGATEPTADQLILLEDLNRRIDVRLRRAPLEDSGELEHDPEGEPPAEATPPAEGAPTPAVAPDPSAPIEGHEDELPGEPEVEAQPSPEPG